METRTWVELVKCYDDRTTLQRELPASASPEPAKAHRLSEFETASQVALFHTAADYSSGQKLTAKLEKESLPYFPPSLGLTSTQKFQSRELCRSAKVAELKQNVDQAPALADLPWGCADESHMKQVIKDATERDEVWGAACSSPWQSSCRAHDVRLACAKSSSCVTSPRTS